MRTFQRLLQGVKWAADRDLKLARENWRLMQADLLGQLTKRATKILEKVSLSLLIGEGRTEPLLRFNLLSHF